MPLKREVYNYLVIYIPVVASLVIFLIVFVLVTLICSGENKQRQCVQSLRDQNLTETYFCIDGEAKKK